MNKKLLAILITCLIIIMSFSASVVTATEVTVPEAYVDFDFIGGKVTDVKGNASASVVGNATVGLAEVSVGNKTATLNALQITEGGQYVLCKLKKFTGSGSVKSWAENGFSVEAFYVMYMKSGVQGVICGTENVSSAGPGGWGIAENAGKPYFITGSASKAYLSGPSALASTSSTDLVHVVAVYDFANKKQKLYINGTPLPETAITDGFNAAGEEAFNTFCLGADYMSIGRQTATSKVDYATPSMTMVDAKIYSGALTSEQIAAEYQNELATLDNPNSVYVDFDFENGNMTDIMGHASITIHGGVTVGMTNVKAGDKSAELEALNITAKNQYVSCGLTGLETKAEVEAWASKGFAVEAFYKMSDKNGVQSVISSLSGDSVPGGWSITETDGKPGFITGTDGKYISGPVAGTASSSEDLVHVLAVYDVLNGVQRLYINGVELTSTPLDGNFTAAGGDAFNIFCIGANYKTDATVSEPVNAPALDMTLVDAKIYSSVLSAEQVAFAYKSAASVLKDKYEKFALSLTAASKLKVDAENNLLTGVTVNTSAKALLAEFTDPDNILITDKDSNELNENDIIGTGTLVSLKNGDDTIVTLTVSAKGDVSGDGKVDTLDIIRARLIAKNAVSLGIEFTSAADVTGSVGVNTADIIKLRLFTKGIITAFMESTTFDKDNIVFSFAALSDLHVTGSTTNEAAAKVKNAFAQLKTQALIDDDNGLDAVFVAGDVVDGPRYYGRYEEMTTFKEIYDASFDVTKVPFVYAAGNHDLNWSSNPVASLKVLDDQLGSDYFLTDIDKENASPEGNRHCVINGYHVITLMPASEYPVTYTEATKTWLKNTLDAITAENPNQYIFILNHPMIYNTTYGSDLYTGTSLGWYTTDLTSILKNYNQVVTFGGHVHFPLNDPRSIMQTAFTSLGCGSVNYMAIEAGGYENMSGTTTMNDKAEFSQGLLVQLDSNGNMRITRMDFYNGDVIGEELTASYPVSDSSHLDKYSRKTRSAANTAPELTTANVTLKAVSGTSQPADITFSSAIDDEFAHHYIVTVAEKGGAVIKTYTILSDFYRHPKTGDMKTEWKISGVILPVNTTCTVTITAVDSWGAESTALVKEFSTAKVVLPSDLPDAYVDIDFSSGSASDKCGNVTVELKAGAAVGSASVKHGTKNGTMNALKVTSKNQYALCKFKNLSSAAAVKSWVQSSFTVEAFYVMGEKSGVQGAVCATEFGGWGVAESAGKPYFITGSGTSSNSYNSGAYATGVSSTTELVHVVAVYDFASKKNLIYINGVLAASTDIKSDFFPGTEETFNMFCLGADVMAASRVTATTPIEYPSLNMTMVDAKIYSQALTSVQVTTAYKNAVDSVK